MDSFRSKLSWKTANHNSRRSPQRALQNLKSKSKQGKSLKTLSTRQDGSKLQRSSRVAQNSTRKKRSNCRLPQKLPLRSLLKKDLNDPTFLLLAQRRRKILKRRKEKTMNPTTMECIHLKKHVALFCKV